MDTEDRKSLINSHIQKLFDKVSSGAPLSYLIISEKKSNKYIQCTVSTGEEEVLIDVPEGQLGPEEVDSITQVLSDICGEKEVLGFQIKVPRDEVADVVDKIFINGFGLPSDYEIEITLLE